jgi:hypothetical protein
MVVSPGAALSGTKVAIIGHVAAEDRMALLSALKGHTVIDLVGLADLRDHPGIAYEGFCW